MCIQEIELVLKILTVRICRFMNFGFDWQYITSSAVTLPLVQQGMFEQESVPASSKDTNFNPITRSEFMGRYNHLLRRCDGHLLFERLECEWGNTTPFGRSWY